MRMLVALTLAGAGALLGSCNLAQPRTLTACADPNNLPFSNKAGEGFENKLSQLIAGDLHAKLAYIWWAQHRGGGKSEQAPHLRAATAPHGLPPSATVRSTLFAPRSMMVMVPERPLTA